MVDFSSSSEVTQRGKGTTRKSFSMGGLATNAILLAVGYMLLTGAVAWSSQLQVMAIIGFGLWWVTK